MSVQFSIFAEYKCKVNWIIYPIEKNEAVDANQAWYMELSDSTKMFIRHVDKQWTQVLPTAEQM